MPGDHSGGWRPRTSSPFGAVSRFDQFVVGRVPVAGEAAESLVATLTWMVWGRSLVAPGMLIIQLAVSIGIRWTVGGLGSCGSPTVTTSPAAFSTWVSNVM